ncbi:hypothetical protein SEVIR_3G152350v4 [Setaria viridis]
MAAAGTDTGEEADCRRIGRQRWGDNDDHHDRAPTRGGNDRGVVRCRGELPLMGTTATPSSVAGVCQELKLECPRPPPKLECLPAGGSFAQGGGRCRSKEERVGA